MTHTIHFDLGAKMARGAGRRNGPKNRGGTGSSRARLAVREIRQPVDPIQSHSMAKPASWKEAPIARAWSSRRIDDG